MSNLLSIVVPAYNEEKTLSKIIERVVNIKLPRWLVKRDNYS
ncbi:MAG: hypothetical protein KatS3mg085_052 [Candidatus Dojkabacteria bacterium]|nr:MAG: hypothetical protein KatS3mg085_052 [Candidatus Dojkabacteria bacterium]